MFQSIGRQTVTDRHFREFRDARHQRRQVFNRQIMTGIDAHSGCKGGIRRSAQLFEHFHGSLPVIETAAVGASVELDPVGARTKGDAFATRLHFDF